MKKMSSFKIVMVIASLALIALGIYSYLFEKISIWNTIAAIVVGISTIILMNYKKNNSK
jgi:uncharacterized membrane protein